MAAHAAQGVFEVRFPGDLQRKIPADDEVVDIFEKFFDAGICLVEVGNNEHTRFSRPACGLNGSCGVVSIDVKGSGVYDPFAVEFRGTQYKAFIAAAKDSALAGGVDDDERLRAGAAGDRNKLRLHACMGELAAMEFGGLVVAELADISCGQAPALTRDNSGCDLSTRKDADRTVFNLRAGRGKAGERDEGVGGVQSNSDQINLREVMHSEIRSVRLQLVNRQPHLKAGCAGLGLHGYVTSMATNDALRGIETEAKA